MSFTDGTISEDYDSMDQCILDIMANTDTQYRVAILAAKFVFEEGWCYNCGDEPRSVLVSPAFEEKHPMIIFLGMEE